MRLKRKYWVREVAYDRDLNFYFGGAHFGFLTKWSAMRYIEKRYPIGSSFVITLDRSKRVRVINRKYWIECWLEYFPNGV